MAKRELRSMELGNFISECLIKDMEKRPFAKQLIRHPFFAHVTERLATIRKELKEEIQRQRSAGVLRRQAEVTTKHGQLKPDRKSKPQKIYMDDLGNDKKNSQSLKKKNMKRNEENFTFSTMWRHALLLLLYVAGWMAVYGVRDVFALLHTILTYQFFLLLLFLLLHLAVCGSFPVCVYVFHPYACSITRSFIRRCDYRAAPKEIRIESNIHIYR